MTEQLDLLNIPLARRTDPHTSHEAAESLARRATQRRTVLMILRGLPEGVTDEELVSLIGANLSPSGVRTRRHELVEQGLVVDTGIRRKTNSGRSAIVWAAAA